MVEDSNPQSNGGSDLGAAVMLAQGITKDDMVDHGMRAHKNG